MFDDDDPPEEELGPDIPSIDHPIMEEPNPEAKYEDMIPSVDTPEVDSSSSKSSSTSSNAFGKAVLLANFGILSSGLGVLLFVFTQQTIIATIATVTGIICLFAVILIVHRHGDKDT